MNDEAAGSEGPTHEGTGPEDGGSSASSYLLTWNPSSWQWTTLRGDVQAVLAGEKPGESAQRWSCGNNTSIKPDARLFLLRQGDPPRGVVGSAFATSAS